MRTRLSQKQETFCLEYFRNGNATEAALVAKYSPHTAAFIGSENLNKPLIAARLAELRKRAEDASIMSVVERKARLSEIARARVTDYQESGADGGYISIGKESPNTAALSEIVSTTKYDENGASPTLITRIRLHNPVQAIAELNKMEKLYSPESPGETHNTQINIVVDSPAAQSLLQRVLNGERTQQELSGAH